MQQLVILGYHKIGPPSTDWETWFYVPTGVFRDQISSLLERGWVGISLDTFLAGLDDPPTLPEKSMLVTFDDGFRSVLTEAVPELQELRLPGVMFVPTDFIGRSNQFDDGAEPEEPICSWAELKELEASNVAVQSHAASHRRLSGLSPRDQAQELTRSRETLEQGLGRSVDVLAYPYGDDGGGSPTLRELARGAGYRAGCLYGGGSTSLPPPDPFGLPRVAMGPDSKRALSGGVFMSP